MKTRSVSALADAGAKGTQAHGNQGCFLGPYKVTGGWGKTIKEKQVFCAWELGEHLHSILY